MKHKECINRIRCCCRAYTTYLVNDTGWEPGKDWCFQPRSWRTFLRTFSRSSSLLMGCPGSFTTAVGAASFEGVSTIRQALERECVGGNKGALIWHSHKDTLHPRQQVAVYGNTHTAGNSYQCSTRKGYAIPLYVQEEGPQKANPSILGDREKADKTTQSGVDKLGQFIYMYYGLNIVTQLIFKSNEGSCIAYSSRARWWRSVTLHCSIGGGISNDTHGI